MKKLPHPLILPRYVYALMWCASLMGDAELAVRLAKHVRARACC